MTHPRFAVVLSCALTLALHAADPPKPPDAGGVIADSAVRQAQLNRAFESFRQKLAVLAGRLELSTDEKDKDRAKAIAKMADALDNFTVEGVPTTIPLHRTILASEAFQANNFHTRWLEQDLFAAQSEAAE